MDLQRKQKRTVRTLMRTLKNKVFLLIFVMLIMTSPSFAEVGYNEQLGLVTMSVADLKDYQMIASDRDRYIGYFQQSQTENEALRANREFERYLWCGVGFLIGWVVTR